MKRITKDYIQEQDDKLIRETMTILDKIISQLKIVIFNLGSYRKSQSRGQ